MLHKKQLLDLETHEKVWSLKFNDAYIWDYVRSRLTNQYLPYGTNKISIHLSDVTGFFKFLSVFFKKSDCIFVVGRLEMLDYIEQIREKFGIENPAVFIREESSDIRGNAKIIESIRYLLRLLSRFLWSNEFNNIKKSLLKISTVNEQLSDSEVNNIVSNFLGDLYFNRLLRKIIKGRVFYTNCVVPKVERSMQILNSYEIQHGVVHDNHPDYYSLPMNYRFIAMNKRTVSILKDMGFQGNIIEVDMKYRKNETDKTYDIIIFTTVSESFSVEVDRFFLNNDLHNLNIRVQPHPKDKYIYSDKVMIERKLRPIDGEIVIMGDSTLIFQCLEFDKHFYLLDPEVSPEIEINIRKKYGDDIKFTLVRSLSEIDFTIRNNV